MTKIQTRPFQFGNEKESSWPPLNGTGETGSYYWDAETQTFREGFPPPRVAQIGQAPMYFSDVMPEQRHPKTGEIVNSRARWRAIDKATGCITTGKNETPCRRRETNQRQKDEEIVGRIKKAVEMIDSGTAPLSERTREMCKRQNEAVSSALGMDAQNVLGRTNGRRKRKR